MSTNGAMPLAQVRAKAAEALAPTTPNQPTVLADLVDSVEPPALMLTWGDPWLVPRTIGMATGHWDAQLEIVCLAGRIEPGAGVETLERLVAYAITRMDSDPYSWPVATSQAPRVFDIGGIPLLGARLVYRVPVAIESEVQQ
jgi:hypothetical protein